MRESKRESRFSSEGRSRIMATIRKRDTKPELAVRRFLHAEGLRYLQVSGAPLR